MPTPIQITDWDDPYLPLPLRCFNAVGGWPMKKLVSLRPDDLLALASKKTGLANFGDESFREPFSILMNAIETETALSPFGRYATRRLMLQLLTNRLRLEELYRLHPEIEDEVIERPIIICGLPRTGTTHLFNLLSLDSGLRWMPYWESLEPFPDPDEGPGADMRDARIGRCDKALGAMEWIMPHFRAMHEFTCEGPHEEIQLLAMDFSSMLFEASYFIPSYTAWYKQRDHRPTYAYLKRVLKALQFLRPGERWLLKSPQHLGCLDALVGTFPDATFLQTHRDPVRITASLATMVAYGARMQTRRPDVRARARLWQGRTEDLLRAGVRDRELLPAEQVMDVHFKPFMADMPGTVKRVMEFAGREFSFEMAQAVDRFLRENPKGKHGVIDYRLEDLGLDAAERREALAFYGERFAVAEG